MTNDMIEAYSPSGWRSDIVYEQSNTEKLMEEALNKKLVVIDDGKMVSTAVFKKDTNAIVEEIHNEFNTVGERILQVAKQWTEEPTPEQKAEIDKVKRLKKLGFTKAANTQDVKLQNIINKVETAEKLAADVMYYQRLYPLNRFITETAIEIICKKYNLIFGGSDRYKGDIPEKNLIEIENFKMNSNDDRNSGRGMDMSICAPQSDMIIKSFEKVEGHKIVNVPDPVVLQKVDGGYLIVSAWGEEAEDDMVKNGVNN